MVKLTVFMEMALIPGYRDLFGEHGQSYEELMKDIPTSIGTVLAIALNAELWDGDDKVQIQLRQKLAFRFSKEQLEKITNAFIAYRVRTGNQYGLVLFERMYLLAMIIRELNRNVHFELKDTSPQQEFNFLMSYLLIIDEYNQHSYDLIKLAADMPKDENTVFRLIWGPLMPQYQFNEKPDVPYELFKVCCLLRYALDHYRDYLREYLKKMGCNSISNLLGSFYQLIQGVMQKREDQFLPGLCFFKPQPEVDDSHLIALAVNRVSGKPVTIADLKRYPLYYDEGRGYIVIDRGFCFKKLYRGPFFELRDSTGLAKKMGFNAYSSNISKKVLEEMCFRGILSGMKSTDDESLILDDSSANAPDAYYRREGRSILFEFKAYLFPDELPDSPDFDALKGYIDQKFIETEGGKPKGIGQIIRQIELMATGKAPFDKDTNRKLRIYPIICFDDFYFTLPGVNEYLNKVFLERLPAGLNEKYDICPLTMINLNILFDLSVKKTTFRELETIIDQYWAILEKRRIIFDQTKTQDSFLGCRSSFDEVFNTELKALIVKPMPLDPLTHVLQWANITQLDLDTIV